MVWWVWVLVGFGLLALELFTPGGFYVLFFGIQKFGELANATDSTMIVPAGVADVAGMVATAMGVIRRWPPNGQGSGEPASAGPPAPASAPESPFRRTPPGWAKPPDERE